MKGVKDAFSRLSGAKETTINLHEGLILAITDPSQSVTPAQFWQEVQGVGFLPVKMEVWATGTFEGNSFDLDGGSWPLANAAPSDKGPRRAHFRILTGSEDPPKVEFLK